jgi:hypothetical protein
MSQLNAAWAVLGDKRLRAAYDAARVPQSLLNTPPVPVAGDSSVEPPQRGVGDSSGTIDFGRYAGWSLKQVVQQDPNYAEWLIRTPIGRRLAPEARVLLDGQSAPSRGRNASLRRSHSSHSPEPSRFAGLSGRIRFRQAPQTP